MCADSGSEGRPSAAPWQESLSRGRKRRGRPMARRMATGQVCRPQIVPGRGQKGVDDWVVRRPTVSPLTILLVCCHINSFCRASSVARPWPGGKKRRSGRASHHEACEAIGSFPLLCAATGVSLLAVWCLSGATPRGQPWTLCRDAPAWARRAEREADGGVVYISRALSVSPRAP